MTKTLTNFAFVIASLIVLLVFVTSNTYPQLVTAVILYPALIFLGFMIFPRARKKSPEPVQFQQPKVQPIAVQNSIPKTEATVVADIDRRTFIKLIGATGISFFLFSIFGRGIEQLIFGRNGNSVLNPGSSGEQFGTPSASPTDGYKISEIDESEISYYGFTNQEGAWLVMQEGLDGGTFRYAKGGTDFSNNWKNREKLKYDYYHNLFNN